MARLSTRRTLATQTLIYDEIRWTTTTRTSPLLPSSGGPATEVRGLPAGARAGITKNLPMGLDAEIPGISPENARPPYWEFDYELDANSGLRFSKVVVRDARSAGSSDNVFEWIEFDDFGIEFTDGTTAAFDMPAALVASSAELLVSEQGRRTYVTPNDRLFQRGLKLTLRQDVLASTGLSMFVTLEISVVFRGAANDFDPGGVPVALDLWPQIGWTWEHEHLGQKVVKRMRGSVKLLANNMMHHAHDDDGPMPAHENVASYFTDSNESMNDDRDDDDRLRTWISSWAGKPFGWLMVFDYLLANMTTEKEIVGVYGPLDGNKYDQTTPRRVRFRYPVGTPYRMTVAKKDRQGDYDNVHTHAKMPNDSCGNVPIHAPFCGHSCIHLHWRWAGLAAEQAEGDRGWQFRGWDKGVRRTSRNTSVGSPWAYALNGSPLVPPNQRLMFALCRPNAVRHNADHIIDPASPGALDVLRKLYWYCTDINEPKPLEKQVIFEHGIGWAYRYALPIESSTVDGLATVINDELPIFSTPTQAEMMEFFNTVYELFRYRDAPHIGSCVDGVPQGTFVSGTVALQDL